MAKKLIAIGNRIMKDDGVAIAVAERMREWFQQRGIRVVIGETDVEFCLKNIQDQDLLLIIDATCWGIEPAAVTLYPLKEVGMVGLEQSQHQRNLIGALHSSQKEVEGYLIGIEAKEIGFDDELSDTLKNQLNNICQQIKEYVMKILEDERDA